MPKVLALVPHREVSVQHARKIITRVSGESTWQKEAEAAPVAAMAPVQEETGEQENPGIRQTQHVRPVRWVRVCNWERTFLQLAWATKRGMETRFTPQKRQ